MKRTLAVLLAVGTVAALVAVTAWAKPQGKPEHKGGKTIKVIEHATTDATTDTGAPDDSAGDLLTFANGQMDRFPIRGFKDLPDKGWKAGPDQYEARIANAQELAEAEAKAIPDLERGDQS